jgi:hypothetical protein
MLFVYTVIENNGLGKYNVGCLYYYKNNVLGKYNVGCLYYYKK